ncbi:MAG: hypothetical protein JNK22_04555 [Rhodocyclaceae bacterium]|nr:hypothetical protein [Rhodocyclaceae bacterium]
MGEGPETAAAGRVDPPAAGGDGDSTRGPRPRGTGARRPLWLAGLASLAAGIVLVEAIAESPAASPGFVLVLVAAGLPPVAQLVAGFASIFGTTFLRLGLRERIVAVILAGLVASPALGGAAFVLVSVQELRIQLSCGGAACAQGGIGVLIHLPFAWAGAFLANEMSVRFARRHWWPGALRPRFGRLFE